MRTKFHRREDMLDLVRQTGNGCFTTGLGRLANACGLDRDHVRFWIEQTGKIPVKWIEVVQQECELHSGKRAALRYEDSKVAMRRCLRCSKDFTSEHNGHRICNNCKLTKDFQECKSANDASYSVRTGR